MIVSEIKVYNIHGMPINVTKIGMFGQD